MQDHHFALKVAEDKNVAIAEVGFLDRLFESHGTDSYGIFCAYQVNFGGFGNGRKLVYDE